MLARRRTSKESLHRRGGTNPRRGFRTNDRGTSAVEFALVVPVLMLLVIGMLEFAFVLRDYLGVISSVRLGTRIAATGAGAGPGVCPGAPVICAPTDTPLLAQTAANAIKQAGTAMPMNQIDYIWIYKANQYGWPTNSYSSNVSGSSTKDGATCVTACVKFTWNQSMQTFQYTSGTWNSTKINACINDVNNAESVGVYMKTTHQYLTRMFGITLPIQDKAVMKFEPLEYRSCNALGVGHGGHQ